MFAALIALALQLPPQAAQQPAFEAPAEDILERAIAVQSGGDIAKDVRDFQVRFYLTTSGDKGKVELDVECKFKAPNLLRTHVVERAMTGTVYDEGFDGTDAWFKEGDQVTKYEPPDHVRDRDRVLEQTEQLRLLLRFFFLANLKSNLTELRRLPNQSQGDVEAYVLRARAEIEEYREGPTDVTLWIDQKSGNLLGVKLEPVAKAGVSLHFCFWFHGRNPQGVLVPGNIKLFRDGAAEPSDEFALHVEQDGKVEWNSIRFNTGLAAAAFDPNAK